MLMMMMIEGEAYRFNVYLCCAALFCAYEYIEFLHEYKWLRARHDYTLTPFEHAVFCGMSDIDEDDDDDDDDEGNGYMYHILRMHNVHDDEIPYISACIMAYVNIICTESK